MNSLERSLVEKAGYDNGWERSASDSDESVVLTSSRHGFSPRCGRVAMRANGRSGSRTAFLWTSSGETSPPIFSPNLKPYPGIIRSSARFSGGRRKSAYACPTRLSPRSRRS